MKKKINHIWKFQSWNEINNIILWIQEEFKWQKLKFKKEFSLPINTINESNYNKEVKKVTMNQSINSTLLQYSYILRLKLLVHVSLKIMLKNYFLFIRYIIYRRENMGLDQCVYRWLEKGWVWGLWTFDLYWFTNGVCNWEAAA